MKRVGTILVIIGFVLVGFGLFKSAPKQISKAQFKISASFYPLYYFAAQIAGDKAEVLNITPAGAEPHDYEPTPRDAANIETSRLVILNGGNLETWGNKLEPGKNQTIISVGQGLETMQVAEGGQKITDPHVWLSPLLAKQEADIIFMEIKAVDPANASTYDSNWMTLSGKFDALDTKFRSGLKNCLVRSFVTSHDAFGYLAAQYNLTQIPITGISPDAEPSPKQLSELAALIRRQNIKYVFFESLVSPKLADTLAHEVGANTLVLNPLEGLTADQMQAGQDYFTIMEENLKNLRLALQCK